MKYCVAHFVFNIWAALFLHSVVRVKIYASVIPDSSLMHISEENETFNGGKLHTHDIVLKCPRTCRCNVHLQQIVTDCSAQHLKTIPPLIFAATTELRLIQNELSDLTYNSSLVKLEILNVCNNSISSIDKHWLVTLQSLHNLDLSRNNLQFSDIENLFLNLSLNNLNLSFNKLEKVSQYTFMDMSSLKVLDMSGNQIRQMDDTCFHSLYNLEELNLSYNYLDHLKHEWFAPLINLKTLILRKNELKLVNNIIFYTMNKLNSLDLSQNEIYSVGLLSFKGLSELESLNISNNNIQIVQQGTFRPLENSKIIDISNNSLQNFDGIFKYSTNLEVLHLKYLSRLSNLTAHSFVGLSRLKILDLSGSKSLAHINQYAFSTTKRLKTLDISNSNLTTLKGGMFKELYDVEMVILKGNPWRCDCYLYWLLVWLGEHTNAHVLSPSDTLCHFPSKLNGSVLLDALDHGMVCSQASVYHHTENASFRVGSTALLQCRIKGSPLPILTWITPQKFTFHWLRSENKSLISESTVLPRHHSTMHVSPDSIVEDLERERFMVLKNGDLLIKDVERGDGGFYMCVASNPLNNASVAIHLTLDYNYLTHIKIVSILVGLATSFGFLLLTLISVLIKMILRQCGVKCPCRNGKSSPKSQQIRKVLESMEHYKKQQLERLRENYNFQVQRIKDNCMQQMERLRESYSSQAERLRDICDYGTLQIDRIRENYYLQVQRVREYSVSQIERLRENYLLQRNRIRKFSANHLYKLRENYKLQQQHLNKILENLNIESCRNVCQRTDSIIFEPDITLENVFVPKICLAQSLVKHNSDSIDDSSQISAYFTPDDIASDVSGQDSDHDIPENNCAIINTSDIQSCINLKSMDSPDKTVDIINCMPEPIVTDANETIV